MPTTYLERREEIASGTMAFHFGKPAGFDFKAGQAIVSAPFENELVIATRMRDSLYKHTLKELPPGSGVTIEGPSGSLVLHKDRSRPAAFIAVVEAMRKTLDAAGVDDLDIRSEDFYGY
jgi:hypothetical protein